MEVKDKLTLSLIQSELSWENPEANRNHFAKKIDALPESDLVILPEMFTTGFSMNSALLAESNDGTTLSWMKGLAKKHDTALTGSVIIEEDGNHYNRMFFVFPDGEYKNYDKKHLFTFADEEKSYSPGNKKLILEYKGWKICPLICYDLRFPVWARNTENYDLLFYVANWPKARTQAWDTLLRARAIENMCYTAGVNRFGTDGNQLDYEGHSAIYNALGDQLSRKDFEGVFSETLSISKSELEETRKKMAFLNDRDEFLLKDGN